MMIWRQFDNENDENNDDGVDEENSDDDNDEYHTDDKNAKPSIMLKIDVL